MWIDLLDSSILSECLPAQQTKIEKTKTNQQTKKQTTVLELVVVVKLLLSLLSGILSGESKQCKNMSLVVVFSEYLFCNPRPRGRGEYMTRHR